MTRAQAEEILSGAAPMVRVNLATGETGNDVPGPRLVELLETADLEAVLALLMSFESGAQ